MKRKSKTPTPRPEDDAKREARFKAVMAECDAREARIQSKTVGDLAGMVRAIVASRGKGENRLPHAGHPLLPAIFDALSLAHDLETKEKRVASGLDAQGREAAPPDPAAGLQANTINRLAVLLMHVLERMKRGEADAGENADLQAAADTLDGAGGKAQDAKGRQGTKPEHVNPTLQEAAKFIRQNPGSNADAIGKHCGVVADTVRNFAPTLKKMGFTSARGCTGGYWPPA